MILERRSLRGRIEEVSRTLFVWLAMPMSLLIIAWWIDPRQPMSERLLSPARVTIRAGESFTVQREICAAGLVGEHRQLQGENKVVLLPSYTIDAGRAACRLTSAVVAIPSDLLPGMYEYRVLGEVGLSYNPLITATRAMTPVHVHVDPSVEPTGSNAAFIRRIELQLRGAEQRLGRLARQVDFLEERARRLMLDRGRTP